MKLRLYSIVSLVAVAGLLLAACGSDDDSTTDTAGGGGEASNGAWLEEAEQASKEAAVTPTEIEANEFGPVEPAKGELLYFIGCDQSIPGCVAQVDGFEAAAKAAGYNTEVCDAKFEVAAFQNCMSQAVGASPAAIVNNARPQSDAPEAYAKAHDAEIPVVGQFTSEEPKPATGNAAEVGLVCEREGEILGNEIVAQSAGEANVSIFADTVYRCNGQRADGIVNSLEKCPSCEFEVKRYSSGTAQTDLPPLLQAEIQSNPDLNWMVGTPGFAGTMAADAIRQAGRQSDISVGTFDGDDPELALMRKGEIIQANVLSGVYENGWAVVDVINRLLAGESVPNNVENPTQILLNQENVPAEGTYEGAQNYQQQFKQLWGVG